LAFRPDLLFSIEGRRALVTGGSVSIGRAISLALAAAGADVAIQSHPEADTAFGLANAAETTCSDIAACGRKAVQVAADFGIAGEAERCVRAVHDALGGIDILVIAASVQSRKEFGQLRADELARQTAVNFNATIELLQATLPGMARQGWGRVLSIGSVNQTRPEPQLAVYAALKAAQANLIANLARQYAPHGITLNTLSPGLVATERNRWRRQDAAVWADIQRRANPMGRAGTPEEMAGAALLFCSNASAFITGADLQAGGGGHL
jgi:NAD(P)-dependent dehydrogenase (short-subunit alcohol dehydrogenase family)